MPLSMPRSGGVIQMGGWGVKGRSHWKLFGVQTFLTLGNRTIISSASVNTCNHAVSECVCV